MGEDEGDRDRGSGRASLWPISIAIMVVALVVLGIVVLEKKERAERAKAVRGAVDMVRHIEGTKGAEAQDYEKHITLTCTPSEKGRGEELGVS